MAVYVCVVAVCVCCLLYSYVSSSPIDSTETDSSRQITSQDSNNGWLIRPDTEVRSNSPRYTNSDDTASSSISRLSRPAHLSSLVKQAARRFMAGKSRSSENRNNRRKGVRTPFGSTHRRHQGVDTTSLRLNGIDADLSKRTRTQLARNINGQKLNQ